MHHGSFGIKSPQSVTRLFRPAKALSSVAKSCFEGTCPISIDRIDRVLSSIQYTRLHSSNVTSQVGAQSTLRYTSDGACSSGGDLSTPLPIVASVASVASRLRRLGCH